MLKFPQKKASVHLDETYFKKSASRVEAPMRKKVKLPHFKKVLFVLLAIVVILGGLFSYKVLSIGKNIFSPDKSMIGQIKDFLFSQGKTPEGTKDDRINIALLGIGGEGHPGGNLTDTIIVVSIKPSTKKVAFISVPRDLYVQVPGENYYQKINAIHAIGEERKPGGGPDLTKQVLSDVLGIPIQYYARVDFDGFKKIIDEVGCVNIKIDNSFYDYWHKISFPAGTECMNGDRALAFARARYIEGPEGGDVARTHRNQQIITAVKDKIFNLNTAFDIKTVNNILNILGDHVKTDLQLGELKYFYELSKDVKNNEIISEVLAEGDGTDGLVYPDTEIMGGVPASVLKPKGGNFSEIQKFAQNIFDIGSPKRIAGSTDSTNSSDSTNKDAKTATEKPEGIKIDLRNGTSVTGLAGRVAAEIKKLKFDVLTPGNSGQSDLKTTVIYDLSGGKYPQSLKALKDRLKATQVETQLPSTEKESKADFVIILGQDIVQDEVTTPK